MKIRTGFVSNSSSSSFIISAPSSEKPTIKVELDLSPLIEVTISNEEELRNYMSNHRWSKWEEDADEVELFNKYLEIINSGKSIHIINGCSDGNAMEQFVYENGLEEIQLPGGVKLESID